MNLRPYQQQLITDIRLQYQMGRRRVLAVLPTGGGKTVCFSYIAQSAARKGNRVCILVHRAELLEQASRSLKAMGIPHGLIQAGRGMNLTHAVQVASVGTIARRLHLLPRDFFQLVVVDEAHHTTAGTWSNVVDYFQTTHLLGVTATPIRGDGRGLGEHYETMVQGPTAAWLTDNGFLAQAKVLAPPGFNGAGLRKRMGDYDTKQAEQRVTEIHGDCYSHYCKHLSGQTAIAFCCSVAHAEAVADLFRRQGIAAASIDGTMDGPTRRGLLEDLGTGRLKVLTSCALIGEGVDVPSVGGCILLRPTQSVGLHLQMIGRCLRPSGDKVAVVLDHVGNTLRLGHHLEDRDWSLDGVKKRDREKAPSVKVCPVCFAANQANAQVCCECRHEFRSEVREMKVIPGELVELSRNKFRVGERVDYLLPVGYQKTAKWRSGYSVRAVLPNNYYEVATHNQHTPHKAHESSMRFSSERSEVDRQRRQATDLESLRELARQRGYKAGWAERVHQARLAKRHAI